MSISLVIPTLRIGDKLEEALRSLEGEYDELIVIDDKIDNLSKKINMGVSRATGEYVCISNDDIVLTQGHLRDLCGDTCISPKVVGGIDKLFHAHMWMLPKKVYEEVGGMCEDYDGFYYDDSDMWMRLLYAGYSPEKNEAVVIHHNHPGWTLKTLDGGNRVANNRELFIKKWGVNALGIVE